MSRPVYNPLIENANPSKNIGQKRNVTEIASNEILSISEHSQLTKMQNLDGYRRQMQSHRNGIQMSNCSKWKRTMVEFPSCDMKEHNGTTPDTHTLIQQNKWLRGTDAQIMQTCDTVHNKSKHVPCYLQITSRQVVGVSTVQTPTLVPPGPTPNPSLSTYSQRSSPGNQSTSHFHHMTYSQHATKRSETKHTSLQISIQADLLTVILAAYSPSEPTTQIPTVNLKLCMTIPNIQNSKFPYSNANCPSIT